MGPFAWSVRNNRQKLEGGSGVFLAGEARSSLIPGVRRQAKKRCRIGGPNKTTLGRPEEKPRIHASRWLACLRSCNHSVGSALAPFPIQVAQPERLALGDTSERPGKSDSPCQGPESLLCPTSPRGGADHDYKALGRRAPGGAGVRATGRGAARRAGRGGSQPPSGRAFASRPRPPSTPPTLFDVRGEGTESGGSRGERAGARRGGAGSPSPGAPSRAGPRGGGSRAAEQGGRARAGGRRRAGRGGPWSEPNARAAPRDSSREEEVSEAGVARGRG